MNTSLYGTSPSVVPAMQWNNGAFEDGFQAYIEGYPLSSGPSANVVGDWYSRSWVAGWVDAHAHGQNMGTRPFDAHAEALTA